ncbi:type II secretion system protein [Hydrogenimonas thermophila]|uniref:Prepilin-type N-terminal cleavage/methylation domain-containing protein n=1 Tax=Hydrogenimonas thermophila TaxID=223786 RepID=A0A1I5R2T8_9BACT|nr:type II secretion system protein [Hydrogenimonas thermophila]WOE69721.1 type II secretion system protein [Hydrogenimonas thermophila]WOE72235.1 type II secretion system protein [Hydrogenimonas thermophila]SFP52823.1 hypothetical protein SAMN05216234_12417 [Hydrogenimonas thermophila]
MRQAVTLIELILTIVIIALTFTVVPKIIQVTAKSSEQGRKEDAMFNAIALINIAAYTAWDESNTLYDDILQTGQNNSYECNSTTHYRIGGFYGGRKCENDVSASNLDIDEVNEIFDDIDDFNSFDINSSYIAYCNSNELEDYVLDVNVSYVNDPKVTNIEDIRLYDDRNATNSPTNTKYLTVKVRYNPSGAKGNIGKGSGCIASFYYHSFNLGYVQINRLEWH